MKTFVGIRRLVIGWWIVALSSLGPVAQVRAEHSPADPHCPNCAARSQMSGGDFAPPATMIATPPPAMPAPTFALPPDAAMTHADDGSFAGHSFDNSPVANGAIAGTMTSATPAMAAAQTIVADSEPPIPQVRLKVRVPACAAVGKEFEYRIKVENCSPADAHNVVVRMSLPASVNILRASPQIHHRDTDLQWNLGTMPGFGCHDIVVLAMPIGLADIRACARVTFEHGQCLTTKVMALAPEGSADGRGIGSIPGIGGIPGMPGGPGGGTGEPGTPGGPRGDFDVRVFGPATAPVGQPTTYKVTLFNKGAVPVYQAGVTINWSAEFDEIQTNELINVPGVAGRFWPKGLIDELPPNTSRTVDLVLRARAPGRLCVTASASARASQNPNDTRTVNAKDESCTEFSRGIPGMTLEMFDREDPILKNGVTSYPITVTNQGKAPITNLQVKARIPELFDLDQVRGPGRYRSALDPQRDTWIEFEPLPVLAVGQTQTFEVFVKAKGRTGDARFRVEMTADQLDKGPGGVTRWILEEESTIVVPDEETRVRIREISRQKTRRVSGQTTSDSR